MSNSHETETTAFCLEGRFLDFVIKDGYKLKGLMLATSEGECYIKLAKHLRIAFDWRLSPGTWLQVVGEKKYDRKTGTLKLKAERVMAASSERGRGASAVVRQRGLGGSPHERLPKGFSGIKHLALGEWESERNSSSPPPHLPITTSITDAKPQPTKVATILVCQKSDCMKRGGKAMCQALQSALSDRGLEDQVTIKATGCMKNCKAGPNLVMPDKTRYSHIQATQVPALIDKHFATNQVKQRQDRASEVAMSTANIGSI
ncbi:MAG: (2Fe-2S) ferredoxin domain-containing protein [Fischerella sp.]|jgi:(2Fe-2S) ferredoxin|uniref:(2Fe-2S) ferredoxin domain-containing protein n=1 Tax=Fischerella sp. TaxID=1191 RepID=UPI0017C1CF95|nr:(2Fe-2S) ferredoxin domain-containing protein [Fischerella sp.]NWF58761.1 (2Fe-2S) ferredoxin domain-containing protein [Fischerella sp.]